MKPKEAAMQHNALRKTNPKAWHQATYIVNGQPIAVKSNGLWTQCAVNLETYRKDNGLHGHDTVKRWKAELEGMFAYLSAK